MEKNQHLTGFGALNEYFSNEITPEEFLDELTDIIDEYSRLAILTNGQVIPFDTASRIGFLGNLHRELRKSVKQHN